MMTHSPKLLVAAATLAAIPLACPAPAHAAIAYDQNVTPDTLWGDGNVNGSFTTDRNEAAGIEIGLRGKLRHNASGLPENTFNSNGDGTYTFNAGVAPTQSSPTAEWSYEWSINTNYNGNGGNLSGYTFELGLDSDPGAGTNYITFDPINAINPGNAQVFWDHAMGTNATGNGNGLVAADADEYAANLATYNVAQNSWKPHWYILGFDPTAVGTYDIYLAAFDNGSEVARSAIRINVVPEPASLALAGLGGAMVLLRRRRNNA